MLNILKKSNKEKNLRILRKVGIIEGISYLTLFGITMPLKYMMDMKEPNYIVGLLHGVLFVGYVFWTFLVYNQYNLSRKKAILLLISSLLPFGTFVTDTRILKPLEKQK
jgi:integral membrane protein